MDYAIAVTKQSGVINTSTNNNQQLHAITNMQWNNLTHDEAVVGWRTSASSRAGDMSAIFLLEDKHGQLIIVTRYRQPPVEIKKWPTDKFLSSRGSTTTPRPGVGYEKRFSDAPNFMNDARTPSSNKTKDDDSVTVVFSLTFR